MSTRIRALAAAAFLVVAAVATSEAQPAEPTETATATIDIPPVLFMDVSGTSISFSGVDANDFENGFALTGDVTTIDTRGNVAHDLTVQAASSNFSGGSGTKPATDLLWSTGTLTGPSDGTSMPASAPGDVATALSQGNPGAITVEYGVLLDLATDEPASYSLDFTYTVVPN